jgi:transcriptional regulator with XRE-family HTH domain
MRMKIKRGESYGDFLRRIRARLKVTQTDLALRLGVTAKTVCLWENGGNIPLHSQRIVDEFAAELDRRQTRKPQADA